MTDMLSVVTTYEGYLFYVISSGAQQIRRKLSVVNARFLVVVITHIVGVDIHNSCLKSLEHYILLYLYDIY